MMIALNPSTRGVRPRRCRCNADRYGGYSVWGVRYVRGRVPHKNVLTLQATDSDATVLVPPRWGDTCAAPSSSALMLIRECLLSRSRASRSPWGPRPQAGYPHPLRRSWRAFANVCILAPRGCCLRHDLTINSQALDGGKSLPNIHEMYDNAGLPAPSVGYGWRSPHCTK